ncbi:lipopolysaccharide biosynthesis protein [Anatilimnocola floriformis]|uniref:lipopolysaccharide biosynthesis protein n=1 Tax=Anatilimnocola floriformis TaxID=2948575 RepID=UPI0020C23E43|nr:MATE family efflux transporter [Anatilimnocola floriformis]
MSGNDEIVMPPVEAEVKPAQAGALSQSAMWVVIARGWNVAASAALSFLLPRWFGANVGACGEVLLVLSLVGIAAMIGSFGLPETMIRHVAANLAQGNHSAIRLLVRRCGLLLLMTSMTTAALTAAYFWLDGFERFHLPGSILLAVVVGSAIVALAWQMVGAAVLRGMHEVKWANLLSGGQSGGPIAVSLFLAVLATMFLLSLGVTSTRAAQVLSAAITFTAVITLWQMSRALPATGSSALDGQVPSVSELAFDALPIALSQIAAFCTLSADLWLVSRFFGTDDVAFYGSAKRLVLLLGIPEQLAMLTIIAVIPSLYARGQIAELQRVIRQATSLAALPAIIAAVALIVLPQQVLGLAFGPQYKAAAGVLVILTLGQLTANCLGPCGYVLLMTGRRWTVLCITLVCGVSAIVVGAIGAHFGGLMGLAIAAAICTATQITLEWLAARYFVGVWCHASPLLIQAAVTRARTTPPPKESPL